MDVMPDLTSDEQESLASIFADPTDLRRYQEAISNGASEEEALKVGDNGVGAWGDNTASLDDPIVALPPNMPGVEHNRLVQVTGPKGTVVARIADKGPDNGRIDLNPAAALAVGHSGGLSPVKWKFLDGTAPSRPNASLSNLGAQPEVPNLSVMPDIAEPNSLSGVNFLSAIDDSEQSYEGEDLLGQGQMPDLNQSNQAAEQSNQSDAQDQTGAIKLLAIPAPNIKSLTKTGETDKYVEFDGGYRWYPKAKRGDGHMEKDESGSILKWSGPSAKAEVITPRAEKNPIYKQHPETKELYDITDPKNPKPVIFPETKVDIPEGATGEAAIAKLERADQEKVKGWATYDKRPPMSGTRGDPAYNRLYPYIKAYNPDYDETDFLNALNIKKQFSSSSPTTAGGQITSVNTAIDHLGTLYEAAEKLDQSKLRKYNSLAQYLSSETGSPEVVAFNAAQAKVDTEIARAFRGGVPTNIEIEEGRRSMSASNSKEQLAAVIKGIYPEMLNARLGEIGFEYERFFGKPFPGLVRPSSRKVLDRFGVKDFGALEEQKSEATPSPSATPSQTPAPQSSPPPKEDVQAATARILADPNSSEELKTKAHLARKRLGLE